MSSTNQSTLIRWLHPKFQRTLRVCLIFLLSLVYSHPCFASELSNIFSGQLEAGTTAITDDLVDISDSIDGTAIVVSSDSQAVTSPTTKFRAGISVDSEVPTLMAQAEINQPFVLNATIVVDPAHIGQTADLVMVVGAEMQPPFEGNEDTVYAAVNEQDEFVHIDLYQPQTKWNSLIVPFKTEVTLTSDIVLTPREGQFDMVGQYYFFVGYRLASGNIIYNPVPIMLEVVEMSTDVGEVSAGPHGPPPPPSPTVVCVYEHGNYGGWEKCYTSSQSNFVSLNINDQVSSIKVSDGAIAVLYNDANYSGTSYVYDANTPSLISNNDAGSSLKIFNRNSPVACVYPHGYNDTGNCLEANTPDFSTLGIDNVTSSIKVYGGAVAVLYDNANYSGNSYVYDANTTVALNNNDTASSLKIFNGNHLLACVYKDGYDNGIGVCLNSDLPDFYTLGINDEISTIKVYGSAVAVLYDNANYSGNSYIYDADTTVATNNNDTASSLKILNSNDPLVCLYKDSHTDPGVCLNADTPDFYPLGINDEVSTIKVYGGAVAVLYDNANYSSNSYIYDANTTVALNNNDTASSLKILNSNDPLVCVYKDGHTDPGVCLNANTPDFYPLGINDTVSSIKVYGGAIAVFYNDSNYGGNGYIYDADTTVATSNNDTASSLKILNSNDPFVCLYKDGYSDPGVCLNANTPDLNTLGLNDAVSSIKVYGGAVAVLYDNGNYSGNSYVYDENTSPVISNDTASSLKFFNGQDPVACIYKDGYNGLGTCLSANAPNLNTLGLNDVVSSIKVYGRAIAVLYDATDYSGNSYVYSADTLPVTSNDTASSLKIFNGNRPVVCLYQHVSYGGQVTCLDADTPNFTALNINDTISSVKVYGGAVAKLYSDSNYGGSHSTYGYNVASVEFNDTYSSLRIENRITITQLNVDGQPGDELVVKILNPNGSGYLIYEPLAVAHFLKSQGTVVDETFVNTLSPTQLDALIKQNTGVTTNTACLAGGMSGGDSSTSTARKINAALETSEDGVTTTVSGTYGAYEFDAGATLTSDSVSLSFAAGCTIATWSNGKHSINLTGKSVNAEFSVSKKGIALGAEASAFSATYALGNTDKSYGSFGVSQGGGASFGAKWGQNDQYGFSGSMLCCSVAVYVSASDAAIGYNKTKTWVLDTTDDVTGAATYLWNESSGLIQSTTGLDVELLFENRIDDIVVGYDVVSNATTMWVSDPAKTVHITLVDSSSAVISTLTEIGNALNNSTGVASIVSDWAESANSVVEGALDTITDTAEDIWDAICFFC